MHHLVGYDLFMPRLQNDETSIRKLSMVGKKTYAVSLPVELVRQIRWSKGDSLIVRRQGNKLVIEKQGDAN